MNLRVNIAIRTASQHQIQHRKHILFFETLELRGKQHNCKNMMTAISQQVAN